MCGEQVRSSRGTTHVKPCLLTTVHFNVINPWDSTFVASLPIAQKPTLASLPQEKYILNNFLCKRRKSKSDRFPEATEILRYPFQGVYYSLSSHPLSVETKFLAWQQMGCQFIFSSLFALIEPLNSILLLSPWITLGGNKLGWTLRKETQERIYLWRGAIPAT